MPYKTENKPENPCKAYFIFGQFWPPNSTLTDSVS